MLKTTNTGEIEGNKFLPLPGSLVLLADRVDGSHRTTAAFVMSTVKRLFDMSSQCGPSPNIYSFLRNVSTLYMVL